MNYQDSPQLITTESTSMNSRAINMNSLRATTQTRRGNKIFFCAHLYFANLDCVLSYLPSDDFHICLPPSSTPGAVSRTNNLRVNAVLTAKIGNALDVAKMSPLGDRLLVKPQAKENTTVGGILLPTAAQDPMMGDDSFIGTILAKGEDVDLEIAVGDRVLFSKYGTNTLEVPDGEIFFVQKSSIMAKLS